MKADPFLKPTADLVRAIFAGIPGRTVIDSVALAKPSVEYTNVYVVPATPLKPRPVKVATPFTAVAVVDPINVPPTPLLMATVTIAFDVVTVFESTAAPSRTLNCGAVVNTEPLTAPMVDLETLSDVAVPNVSEIFLFVESRSGEVMVKV